MSQVIHRGTTEQSSKTQCRYTESARSLPGKDFKADEGVSRSAVQAVSKKHKEAANVEDCRNSGQLKKRRAAD